MVKVFERRRITIVILVSVVVTVCLLITLQTNAIDAVRVRFKGENEHEKPEEEKKSPSKPIYAALEGNTTVENEKLAYVTFLSGTVDQDDDLEKDNYLQAVRILVWQLVHNPETKTKHDVIVMVTPTVSESRRARLKKDGAIIYPVEFLHTENDGWIKAEQHRWDDVMTKMRVWEMTQYSRILMLDGDTMLRTTLDGVFDDPGAQILRTKDVKSLNYTSLPGEAPLPETYLLASLSEVWDSSHAFPPGEGTGLKTIGYMNAGFFIMAPSLPAFEYYKSLMDIENSFKPLYPEQNLMNFAHRWEGPMPWREVAYTWNVRCPTENDFEKGLVSMHEKWWKQPYLYENKKVKDWLLTRRYEMKGWYDAYDLKNQ
jgi:alpha-N-acetylglucosamine transferase